MRQQKAITVGWILVAVGLSACGAPAATQAPGVETPTQPESLPATSQPTTEPQPTLEVSSLEPQRVEFQADDGTQLVGTYWPPVQTPAPGVILMHMMGKDKDSWQPLPALLQGAGIAHEGSQQPSYAVFAFDFRGHGESGGSASDRPAMLDDARAAFATFQALPGVDPGRIALIGASIGADAAVDVCIEGCVGAISLSPGGYLGIAYNDALLALGDKPVLCVASEGDIQPAQTCKHGEQAGLSDYRIQLYTGSLHGTDMFLIAEQPPMLTDLIFEWLRHIE